MSASLNVVSVAVVFWLSSSRSAIRRRIMLIGCRVSRSPGLAIGFGAMGVAGAAGLDCAARTSSLVMRWPGPVAGIVAGSSCLSAMIARAAGDIATSGVDVDLATGTGFGASVGVAVGFPAGSIVATVAPTLTISPAWTVMVSTPAAGAGTSAEALSVSISKRGSSSLTAEPVGFIQRAMRPSVTDSPAAGTVTGIAIRRLPCPYRHSYGRRRRISTAMVITKETMCRGGPLE